MRKRGLKFRLTSGERGGIIKMFDVFRAVRLNDDQLEPDAVRGGSRFAADKCAVPFVKPHHATACLVDSSAEAHSAKAAGSEREGGSLA